MTLFLNEQLLQYIWQHQYFNHSELKTIGGEPVVVLHPGSWNFNQGPDFYHARLDIGDTVWAGTVELHMRTSDWLRHGHGVILVMMQWCCMLFGNTMLLLTTYLFLN